ncbi:hypothetical protein ABGB14_32655 [Nonomuraea sp. B10E15]|uniref:hypothetical protein n=1 Tax=unclassified Nonomuraea TaxID=2593643 RepID=UPI00325F6093
MTSHDESPYATIRATARTEGLVAAALLLHAGPAAGRVVYGPAGHALVPREVAGAQATATSLGEVALHGRSLVALREPARAEANAAWTLGLAWLRYGLSEGLLEHCRSYLGGRTSDGSPLLLLQLVKAQLAEAVIEQLEVLTVLEGAQPGDLDHDHLTALHQRITLADRMLLRLLGGSGFRADGPGQSAHVSELLADAYTGKAAR